MELEHRFEVPVGIDKAWTHLLDMEQVAACFPGATLTSADGAEYTGTVKVKLGPIQLTYAGSARIVSADEASHTATIEASGNAARSGSTAAMTVVASADSVAADRTAVVMKTELTITGRPAQFGRGVMVEVGNKILGMFADCLASKLAASEAAAETPGSAATASDGDEVSGAAAGAVSGGAAGGGGGVAAGTARTDGGGAPTGAHAAAEPSSAGGAGTYTRAPAAGAAEPIDLLASARGSIIRRLAPVVAGLVAILLVRACLRRRRAKRSR